MIPKSLFGNDKYKGLSLDAKVVYAFLRDRMELSKKNNWVDENGDVYLLFSRFELAEMIDCSEPHITKCMKQLAEYGLIEEKRQGLGKPNIIYICHVVQNFENQKKLQNQKLFSSGTKQFLAQELNNVKPNDTYINETNNNETEKQHTHIILLDDADRFIFIYKKFFKKYMGTEHMLIRKNQLSYVLDCLSELKNNDITEKEFAKAVIRHFKYLPKSNNGNILAFLKAMIRYFAVHNPYDVYGKYGPEDLASAT
jgi:hypothetical protein